MSLPRCEKYKIHNTYHTGGLENAVACDNCGRAIVEVAELGDEKGGCYHVGLDCARTLELPANQLEHSAWIFAERKAFLAKLRKARKALGASAPATLHEYSADSGGFYTRGGFLVQVGSPGQAGGFSRNYPVELLPVIRPLCVFD